MRWPHMNHEAYGALTVAASAPPRSSAAINRKAPNSRQFIGACLQPRWASKHHGQCRSDLPSYKPHTSAVAACNGASPMPCHGHRDP